MSAERPVATLRSRPPHAEALLGQVVTVGDRFFLENKPLRILLDGEDVTYGCVSAQAGPHGWVALHVLDEGGHLKLNSSRSAPMERRAGHVRILPHVDEIDRAGIA